MSSTRCQFRWAEVLWRVQATATRTTGVQMDGDDGARRPAAGFGNRSQGGANVRRFRPTLWSALQARRIKLWLALVGLGLFRFKIEVEGLEHMPRGEPLIIAAAPHRNWVD